MIGTDAILGFVLFWGVWLFVPLLIDGTTAVAYFIGALRARKRYSRRAEEKELSFYPLVSIIIPVYNGEGVIGNCLESLRRQSYPHQRLEILVVDNLSNDRTLEIIREEQTVPFGGTLQYLSLPFQGKVGALNAGIHRVNGEIIFNLDADTVLHVNAILEIAREFQADPKLAAATGAIEITSVKDQGLHPIKYAMAEAEYLEYFTGFNIGRQYQSETGSLFTLAGAFSAFRRDILHRTFLYDQRTVSEDTSLTLHIATRFPEMTVRCVSTAVAYVDPVPSLSALYAQRVRWQRGQIEVASLYPTLERHPFRLRGISLPKSLLIDHTLAFPRVVWTFLLPSMWFIGYPLSLVISGMITMYFIYMFVDAMYMVVAYILADEVNRKRIRKHWWIFAFMPAYRWTTFWFRFGGFLTVMTEGKSWRVRDPWTESALGVQRVGTTTLTFLTQSFLPRISAVLSGIMRTR